MNNGADINTKSLQANTTPLIQAVIRNNLIAVYKLISHKVNPK